MDRYPQADRQLLQHCVRRLLCATGYSWPSSAGRAEIPMRRRGAAWFALVCISLLPAVAGAWPWSRDMANQISIKPQHGEDAIRPFPHRSVPMAGTKTLIHVHDRDGAMKLANPNPPTAESVKRGRKFFQIFCLPCHGKSGKGDGLVGAKFLIPPFDLTADREQKELPEGYIYGTVAFGGALMPSYGNDMSPSEVWDLVNYVRHGLVSDGVVGKSGP